MRRNYFDEQVAQEYDQDDEMFDPDVVESTVSFLAELAGTGDAPELGIGTGRIAVTIGDFATLRVDGTFTLSRGCPPARPPGRFS